MPPKKGKKSKKAAEPVLSGPEAEAEFERKALIEEAKMLKKQKEIEEVQCNEFQQEKEKLNYFWIVEKKKIEDLKAAFRNKERETQDIEEKHQVEIKVYKQRIKHLLFEHQSETAAAKTSGVLGVKAAQAGHVADEGEMKKGKRGLKVQLKEMQVAHDDHLRVLKMEQDKAITLLRLEFERECHELQAVYEERMKNLRVHLEGRRSVEVRRIDEAKARHLAALTKAHEIAFQEIKTYYNEITHSNLDKIHTLKEELHDLKRAEAIDDKQMYDIAAENKRMSEPLKRAEADLVTLTLEREEYRKEMGILSRLKKRLLEGESELQNMKWQFEVAHQRAGRLTSERDHLFDQFTHAMYDVQAKAGFRGLLLEKKLAVATADLEKKESQLTEILVSAHLDPAVMGVVAKRLDEVVESKDSAIRELQSELQRVVAAHNRLIAGYERKLGEYGIPVEELGFTPLACK